MNERLTLSLSSPFLLLFSPFLLSILHNQQQVIEFVRAAEIKDHPPSPSPFLTSVSLLLPPLAAYWILSLSPQSIRINKYSNIPSRNTSLRQCLQYKSACLTLLQCGIFSGYESLQFLFSHLNIYNQFNDPNINGYISTELYRISKKN